MEAKRKQQEVAMKAMEEKFGSQIRRHLAYIHMIPYVLYYTQTHNVYIYNYNYIYIYTSMYMSMYMYMYMYNMYMIYVYVYVNVYGTYVCM